jgi:initiation factor 1A
MSYQSSIRNKKNNKTFNKTKDIKYKIDDEIEEYGYVSKMLGNCRCLVISNSHIDCIGSICGTLRKFNKRVLIDKGDIVIITRPSAENNKVIINYKLNQEQINDLIEEFKLNEKLINLYKNHYCSIADEDITKLNELTFQEKDEL